MRPMFLYIRVAAACVLAGAGAAGGQQQGAAAPRRVVHLHVRGDLDNLRLAGDFQAKLRSAAQDGAGLIVVELDGDRWRADVVDAMCRHVQQSAVPVVVLLQDQQDHRVGTGAALVGLAAVACYAEAKTDIVFKPGDDRRELAPKATKWEEVEQSLLGAAAEGQRLRGADVRLPGFLMKPASSMWALEPTPGAAMLLSPTAPPSTGAGSAQFAARVAEQGGAGGGVTATIRPEIAAGLRLVKAVVSRAGEVIADQGAVARPLINQSMASGLGDGAKNLRRSMEHLDSAIESAERTLEVRVPDQRQNTDSLYRAAGRDALGQAQQATALLDEAERLASDYPELVRMPAFGQTEIGTDADDHEGQWRKVIQKRRDKITKLEVKARGYVRR